MNKIVLMLTLAVFAALFADADAVISVSPKNPRYFTESGKTWIPIGCNICFDRLYDGKTHGDAEVRANYERWIRSFAANGGNCIRLWAGHRSLEVMPEKPNVFDEEKAKTLKGIISLCEELDVKVKITFENFRMCISREAASKSKNPAGVSFDYIGTFNRTLYAPYARSVAGFFKSEECREFYLAKARYLGHTLGFADSPAVYCWELWNEINSTSSLTEYAPWSAWALKELKKMFPRQMVVNNLGSFSEVTGYQIYDELATEKDNAFMQVHRYLDMGASLDDCRGPMDVIASRAVRELLSRRPDSPAVLAEIGACQASHAGPFPFYQFDKEGTLLHDGVFSAFFAGSAGSGQFWHWDHQYIDGNRLWWHFARFKKAIEGLDPIAENFRPFYTESRRLRMYGLRGRTVSVVWCRDKQSSWKDELVDGDKPDLVEDEKVPFLDCTLDCYDPWTDRNVKVAAPKLPPFKRSIVVRVPTSATDGFRRNQ